MPILFSSRYKNRFFKPRSGARPDLGIPEKRALGVFRFALEYLTPYWLLIYFQNLRSIPRRRHFGWKALPTALILRDGWVAVFEWAPAVCKIWLQNRFAMISCLREIPVMMIELTLKIYALQRREREGNASA
jgi:hypothetical protein